MTSIFIRNLCFFLRGNEIQFTTILGFVCCTQLLQIPLEIFYVVPVRWLWRTLNSPGLFLPWWTLMNAWDHSPVRTSSASAFSQIAWCFIIGCPDTRMNQSCLPYAAGFQWQRKQSSLSITKPPPWFTVGRVGFFFRHSSSFRHLTDP